MTDLAAPGLTFAVPDLHGRYDLLEDALVAIEGYPAAASVRTVVFLGDYVDRGPQSAKVVERLKLGPPDGWRWICLQGNHEAIMEAALRRSDGFDHWLANGGAPTIASYEDHRDLVADHLAWMAALPLMHVDAHRVFVHAGVDADVPLDEQVDEVLIWKRYPQAYAEGHGGRHVVHGHDPNEDGPLLHSGRTDLDTMAVFTGRLVIGVFDDARAGGPIDLVEVRRRPA